MKRKKILSIVFSTVIATSSLLSISNVVQASNIKTTAASSSINLQSNTLIKKGTITVSSLNVRSDASLKSKILTSLKNSTPIEIVDTVGDWYKIKLNSNYGYVFKQYVKLDTQSIPKNNTSSTNSKKGVVTISHLNVRSSAATNSKILTTLSKNSSVEIFDTIGSWYKIKSGSSYGYVFKEYIEVQ